MLNYSCKFFLFFLVLFPFCFSGFETDADAVYIPHRERLNELPEHDEELRFGNSCYSIQFRERQHKGVYGHDYRFYLTDAVEDVPEYLVDWENFVSCVYSSYFIQARYRHLPSPYFAGWLPSLVFDWSTKKHFMKFSRKKKIVEISAHSWVKWEC